MRGFGSKMWVSAKQNDTFFRAVSLFRFVPICNLLPANNFRRAHRLQTNMPEATVGFWFFSKSGKIAP